jgi:hypothetical protein
MDPEQPNEPALNHRYRPDPDEHPQPALSDEQTGDLAESPAALSHLSAARLDLEVLLTNVATFTVQAIPGADGAELTLLEPDRANTIAKAHPSSEHRRHAVQHRRGTLHQRRRNRPHHALQLPPRGSTMASVRSPGRPHGGTQRPVAAAARRGKVVGAMNVYAQITLPRRCTS